MRIEIALRGDGIREQFRFVLASHRKFNHASATTAFLWSRVINHFSKTVNDCNTLPDRNVSCPDGGRCQSPALLGFQCNE